MIFKICLLSISCLVYLIYTTRYLIKFIESKEFSGGLKVFHIIMIWLIPFIWIMLLNALFKPTPSSYVYLDKKNPDSMSESGLGIWMDESTGQDGGTC